MKMEIHKLYNINIYGKYSELKKSGKELDNYDLSKIFEWFSCIKLYQKYGKHFYEYNDIDPTFKEDNMMTKRDTGIDCCDLIDTIIQCKLRKDTLDWKECGTFFGSQNIFSSELNETIVRWKKLVITRNEECKLSKNLLEKSKLFTDISYPRKEIIDYCENLITIKPEYPVIELNEFNLRDYQKEAIDIIKSNNNITICLPTGTGKNVVIIYSFQKNKKYLVLVPRIILMEQLKEEIIRYKPEFKNTIQLIGDSNTTFNINKNICICVYNSIALIEPYFQSFDKIYIDEAHHINKPLIYNMDENDYEEEIIEIKEEIKEDDYNEDDEDDYNDDEIESEELIDDSEDEIKETKYYNIIQDLKKYNNNVYLSATIDMMKDFIYYKKDIRDMIEQKYLCDYTIHIPIFVDDITNMNICNHMIKNYRNIIIYCNSQKEGKEINKLMNSIQNNCSDYIDCHTSKSKRNQIIKKYKNNEIPFLVNVRILVEGFDAPITKGVCFMHLPSNKTTLIQIIGRALRLHPLKTIANIILPFSKNEDEKNICDFLKVMASNDRRIKKSYENKKLGGYIVIEDEDNDEEDKEIEFRYNMIYSSMGILTNSMEIWEKRLEEVKKYIDENHKRPSIADKDENIKQIARWIFVQLTNYLNKEQIMKNQTIYCKWDKFINSNKYKDFFITNDQKWYEKLEKIKNYMDSNNKRPSVTDKDKNIKQLGQWISDQQKFYSKKQKIMKKQTTYYEWNKFINSDKYKKYFQSYEDDFYKQLEKVKIYIDSNNKRPSAVNKDINIKQLGIWISYQKTNYTKKQYIMKNQTIYRKWNNFINDPKYKKYFIKLESIELE
jgi:superfamily II DNA or RNA helicase